MTSDPDNTANRRDREPRQFRLQSLFLFITVLSATFACFAWKPFLSIFALLLVVTSTAVRLWVPQDPTAWNGLDTRLRNPTRRFAVITACGALASMAAVWIFVRLDHDSGDLFSSEYAEDVPAVVVAAAFGAYSFSLFRNASPTVFGALVGLSGGFTATVALSQVVFPANTYLGNFYHFFYTLVACLVFSTIGAIVGISRFSFRKPDPDRFRHLRITSGEQDLYFQKHSINPLPQPGLRSLEPTPFCYYCGESLEQGVPQCPHCAQPIDSPDE